MKGDLIGSLLDSKRIETRSLLDRLKWPLAAGLVLAVVGGLTYHFRHYDEQQQVRVFLDAVAGERYSDAYAMWDGGESYNMTRFLEDWGEEAFYTTNTELHLVDSESTGSTVTVYVAIHEEDQLPMAIRVHKETGLLSFSPDNKFQRTRIFTPR
jgi:hypothetical protein